MIRNRLGLGLIGVDCRQNCVFRDGDLIARMDERAAFRFPSEEVFAVYRSKDTRTAAREVFLLVFGRFIRTFFFVCYGIAFTGRSKERIKCYRTVQRCVQIEQHTAFAGYNEPCGRCFAGFCLNTCNDRVKIIGLGDFLTILNRECFRLAIRRSTQINGCVDLRRLPFCVERNALCRHRLAGEHERVAFAKLVIIPACKCVTRIYFTRAIRNIVCVSNTGFVLKVLSIIRTAVVNKCEVIRSAGVIELCVIITTSILRATTVFKAGNGIFILLSYSITRTRACIRMMKHIFNSVNRNCITRTGESFHIIICSLTTITGLRSIEFRTIQWHGINIYLIWTSGRINTPSVASLISRPLIPNIRTILRANS